MSDARSILSLADRKRPIVRVSFASLCSLVFLGLVIAGLVPLLWLSKAAVSGTQDIIKDPLALFPSQGVHFDNLLSAWTGSQIGLKVANSAILSVGSALVSVLISVLLAYVISVLRPRWAPILHGLILATLFIPGIVLLVPLYLTVLKLPVFDVSLLNTYWAVWLPVAASPFNVLVVQRYFDALPRELFDAGRVDGAGPWRLLGLIVAPLSRPIIVVVGTLSAIAAWKDFLWPLLVLPTPDLQPVSVALAAMQTTTELSVQMAAVLIALLIPVIAFVVFQRHFLRGVAMAGVIKE